MGTSESEQALLLDTVEKTTADLACNLLREAQIPAVQQGPDFDVAELGAAAHDSVRGVSVIVPKAALEQARKVLRAAWGEDAVPS